MMFIEYENGRQSTDGTSSTNEVQEFKVKIRAAIAVELLI